MEIEKARYSPKKKKPGFIKRVVLVVSSVLVLGTAGGYSFLALGKPVGALTAETESVQATEPEAITIAWPKNGQAAVGTVQDGVLAATYSEQQKPIASITKLVTALAVIEKLPLDPGQQGEVFIVGQADADSYRRYLAIGGSVMPVNVGQSIAEYDALVGMLLPSGNNMADSLVTWVFGSMEAYLAYANEMLDRLGLVHTEVVDASGFSPGSVSTPSDLIRLGQKILQNPVLAEIVAKKAAVVPGSGELRNTNILLGDEDALGIKTGNTDEAGSCLLFAYRFGPGQEHVFIGVVTGQPNYFGMFSTARALKDSALANFKFIEVMPAGTVVGSYKTAWGTESQAATTDPIRVFGWAGKKYEVEISLRDLSLPSVASQVVGEAKLKGQSISSDIVSRTALDSPSIWWKLQNYW